MNINENKMIDEAEAEADRLLDETAEARAEADRLLDEAIENSPYFIHFLRGWMFNEHWEDMAAAARDWLNTYKED